jgi:NAD(P)-dependent dehydrogenase (short-subunit alcohol dehydrogenase family)
MMGRIAGKVAFVSGGASGLGKAMVERFVAEGARVVLGDINEAGGQAVAAATGARFVPLDVRDEASWIAAIAVVEREYGRLDVIVNNAGILGTGPIETTDLADWNNHFAINSTGVMLGCKHGSLLMMKNPGGPSGSIINISSNAAILATASDVGYSAAKGAVRLMTKSIAGDFASRGFAIRCNSIHPGPIDTPIFAPYKQTPESTAALMESLVAMVPMGRIGRPDEIASLALFLASDESSFSTGSEFVADGGGTCTMLSKMAGEREDG